MRPLFFSIAGEIEEQHQHPYSLKPILTMNFATLQDFFVILWSGNLDDTRMELLTFENEKQLTPLAFHGLDHGFLLSE